MMEDEEESYWLRTVVLFVLYSAVCIVFGTLIGYLLMWLWRFATAEVELPLTLL